MQVSTEVCGHVSCADCVHQVQVRDSGAHSNVCWLYGDVGFLKDCTTTLLGQDDDKGDKSPCDDSFTIGYMNDILPVSMPIINLTFRVVQKELVSSAIAKKILKC